MYRQARPVRVRLCASSLLVLSYFKSLLKWDFLGDRNMKYISKETFLKAERFLQTCHKCSYYGETGCLYVYKAAPEELSCVFLGGEADTKKHPAMLCSAARFAARMFDRKGSVEGSSWLPYLEKFEVETCAQFKPRVK